MKKKLIISFIALLTLVLFLSAIGLYIVLANLHMRHRGQDIQQSEKEMWARYPDMGRWADSLRAINSLRDTFLIFQRDGNDVRVHALYAFAPDTTNKTAVIVHGYTDNAVRMLMIGYMYHSRLGYNILLPDLLHSGQSEGEYIGMGWKDRLDVMRWMDIANDLFKGDRIETQMVVHGISMGAATTMMVSGESHKGYTKAFVEDCGYTSVWDEFAQEITNTYGLPPFPFLNVAEAVCYLLDGWTFTEASAKSAVSRSTLPMLFIHGAEDTFVPTYMVNELYNAKTTGYKELWISEGTKHALSYKDHPEEYTLRTKNFLDMFIK